MEEAEGKKRRRINSKLCNSGVRSNVISEDFLTQEHPINVAPIVECNDWELIYKVKGKSSECLRGTPQKMSNSKDDILVSENDFARTIHAVCKRKYMSPISNVSTEDFTLNHSLEIHRVFSDSSDDDCTNEKSHSALSESVDDCPYAESHHSALNSSHGISSKILTNLKNESQTPTKNDVYYVGMFTSDISDYGSGSTSNCLKGKPHIYPSEPNEVCSCVKSNESVCHPLSGNEHRTSEKIGSNISVGKNESQSQSQKSIGINNIGKSAATDDNITDSRELSHFTLSSQNFDCHASSECFPHVECLSSMQHLSSDFPFKKKKDGNSKIIQTPHPNVSNGFIRDSVANQDENMFCQSLEGRTFLTNSGRKNQKLLGTKKKKDGDANAIQIEYLPYHHRPQNSRLNLIGSGSYGSVYLEKDVKSGQLLACKQLALTNSVMDDAKQYLGLSKRSENRRLSKIILQGCTLKSILSMFPAAVQREVLISRKLQHKNIVNFSEILVDNFNIYILMEYIPQTLSDFTENFPLGEMPLAQVHQLAFDLFSGLEYLHSRSPAVIHRDLKPDNLLVSNGRLKICDFSLARQNVCEGDDEAIMAGRMTPKMSTLRYSAPEILTDGRQYSTPIDCWASAVIIAEILVGGSLFKGVSEILLLENILEVCGALVQFNIDNIGISTDEIGTCCREGNDPPLMSYLHNSREFVSPQLDQLLCGCLAVDPSCRISARTAVKLLNSDKK